MLVSIILPCYNVEDYLERCIDSILKQTYRHYEIIIINDGSTDGTIEICKKYEKLGNIKIYEQDNKGVSAARNKGIEIANGKFILFIDPDDYIEENLLEEVIKKQQETCSDVIYYGFKEINLVDNTEKFIIPKNILIKSNSEIIHNILTNFIGISEASLKEWYLTKELAPNKEFASVWRFLYRTDIIKDNNLRFDENIKLGEDTIFNSYYLSYSNSLSTISKSLYNYTIKNSGAMMSNINDYRNLVNNKISLLRARMNLRDRILDEKCIDIEDLYLGSNLLSILELALKLSKDETLSFSKKYNLFLMYIKLPEIRKSISKISLKNAPLKFKIPMAMLKCDMKLIMFWLINIINKLGVKIQV